RCVRAAAEPTTPDGPRWERVQAPKGTEQRPPRRRAMNRANTKAERGAGSRPPARGSAVATAAQRRLPTRHREWRRSSFSMGAKVERHSFGVKLAAHCDV